MPNFSGPEGELSELYLSETDILERYVGNQLWNWGLNSSGQLGNNSRTDRSSPIQTVSGGTNWKQVSCGGNYTAGIKTDGTLWLWGEGANGKTGWGYTNGVSSPVQTVSGGINWKQVSCGSDHTAAIKTDGTLWVWGANGNGQLGDNTTTHRSSPVQTVSGGTNWKQVSCSADLSSNIDEHTAAIKTDGTLWLWGNNTYGQLGTNDIVHRSSPIQTVSGGTNWKQVACGFRHTAAIKTDGTLWLWGQNHVGQLGTNDIVHRSSPIQTVSGGTNWKQIDCGRDHTVSLKTDGTLWLWGWNDSYGQLGDNTLINRSSPVQTIITGTDWKQVTGGGYHTTAIKTNGTLWVWGRNNNNGQLGTNDIVHRSSPVQTIAGGINWKQVSAGELHTAAITYTES